MDYENSVLIIKVAGTNVSPLRLLNVQYMTYIYCACKLSFVFFCDAIKQWCSQSTKMICALVLLRSFLQH